MFEGASLHSAPLATTNKSVQTLCEHFKHSASNTVMVESGQARSGCAGSDRFITNMGTTSYKNHFSFYKPCLLNQYFANYAVVLFSHLTVEGSSLCRLRYASRITPSLANNNKLRFSTCGENISD